MANYVLDKGFLATGSAAYVAGELVVLASATSVEKADTAGELCVGVCNEDIDADKVTTGKAVINVRLMGIARVKLGGTVAVLDLISTTTGAVGVTATTGHKVVGIALEGGASGDFINVLLTPGAVAP